MEKDAQSAAQTASAANQDAQSKEQMQAPGTAPKMS